MAMPSKTYHLKVEQSNIRLDKFLSEKENTLTRSVLQNLISEGQVQVNGQVVTKKSSKLHAGDKVSFLYTERSLKPVTKELNSVYEDRDVIVYDKPPFLPVHPNAAAKKDSLVAAILYDHPEIENVGEDKLRPGIVHRLDADTSGLIVVAKNQSAYLYLKNLFKSRKLEKEYTALVHGKLSKVGQFEAPIGRKAGSKRLEAGFGRQAKTYFQTIGYYTDGLDNFSLVRIILHTGRTHQIRVHFSSDGHPVVGDRLYGGTYKKKDTSMISRQFLHATRLKLTLPSGQEKEFRSELPKDLKQVLENLTLEKN